MRFSSEVIALICVMAAASNAAAESYKCTDASGKVIYTNTACPPGYKTNIVEDSVSVTDGSADRALMAKEAEQARTGAEPAENSSKEFEAVDPAAVGLSKTDLDKLKEAESLAQTAIAFRNNLALSAAVILATMICAFLVRRLFFRRKNIATVKQ